MGESDAFESPRLLLESARHEAAEFDSRARAFLDGCFGVRFTQMDPKSGEQVVKYRVAQKIPSRLRVLASHVVNDLRHSLDQAVNCATIELGGTKPNNYFPFSKSKLDIDRVIKDNCKTVPAALKPILKGFQPYGGGDDLLYSLNLIAGPNKHQLVVRMNLDLTHIVANDLMSEVRGPAEAGFIRWDSARQEIEIARIGPGGHVKCADQAKFPLSITLGHRQATGSEPEATAFLSALVGKVEGILSVIEAETANLKLARYDAGL